MYSALLYIDNPVQHAPTHVRRSNEVRKILEMEVITMIKLQDFLQADILGDEFLAVRGYIPVVDRETQQITAYRLNLSIQDEKSPFFMEMITVKINNLAPTVSIKELENNKTRPVMLKNLVVGQYKEVPWYSAADILPVEK